MANALPPRLHLHAGGQWFVHWGGKNHYLGRNKAAAEGKFLDEIRKWAAWRGQRSRASRSLARNRTLLELAEEFFGTILTDSGPEAERYYRKHSARFLHAWGAVKASMVQPPDVHPAAWLQALKADMTRLRYAPKTVTHDLNAAKRLLHWAGDMGYIPAVSLRSVKPAARGPQRRIDKPFKDVAAYIASAESADPRLGPWLRLHYLGALRPRELVDLVCSVHRATLVANADRRHRLKSRGNLEHLAAGDNAPGWEFKAPRNRGAVYRVRNKVERSVHDWRFLVLSAAALKELALCEPHWTSSDGYYHAIVEARGEPGGPHFLRHSAASHLRAAGAAVEEIRLALGHWPPGAWQNYTRESWQTPLAIMARLRRPPPGSSRAPSRSPERPAPASGS